ncbi:MAG: SDR family oxidoreductase [Pontiellaceae bacterium]|nr:SDR family oxidoreductase [Pontiellaceae bacterium]
MILSGKRALVTGGAVRIGRAITLALQAEGVEVVVHYRHSQAEAEVLSDYTVQGDLEDPSLCADLVERAGPLDILVNNASIFTKESLAQSTYERTLRELQVNLLSPMELIRAFCAQTKDGAVLNLLDRRIRCHDTSCAPYSVSKKGLEELTQLAALEYAPHVRVNAVAPGPILPPPDRPHADVRELAGRVPLEAMPTPEQIAEAVRFLLKADSVTGQTIYVDGGQHLLGNGV